MADFTCIAPFRSAVSGLRRGWLIGSCLLASALVGCAPELNWRTMRVDEAHGLVALFPCKPEHFERTVPWPGVPAGVRMHLMSCEAKGRHWSLSHFTLPDVSLVEPALRQWPEMMLRNFRQASAWPSQVKVTDLGPVNVPHMTPTAMARARSMEGRRMDSSGRSSEVSSRSWHFFHGLTVFQATVSGAPEAAEHQSSEDVAQAFFSAFHFPG